ncbi:MAG: chemotaxis protein CheX [Planctomycetota bacterium]|jgi:chemotaxis protein CheY-P-specific phosphatase CheC
MDNSEMLSDVFSSIMENTVFMFGDSVFPDEIGGPDGDIYKAEISFSGEMSGSLCIVLTEPACVEMAVNLLGAEDESELEDGQPIDALKEVLNITIGNVLTEIAGTKPVFDLTIPEVTKLGKDKWDSILYNENTACFDFDDEPILLQLIINN